MPHGRHGTLNTLKICAWAVRVFWSPGQQDLIIIFRVFSGMLFLRKMSHLLRKRLLYFWECQNFENLGSISSFNLKVGGVDPSRLSNGIELVCLLRFSAHSVGWESSYRVFGIRNVKNDIFLFSGKGSYIFENAKISKIWSLSRVLTLK